MIAWLWITQFDAAAAGVEAPFDALLDLSDELDFAEEVDLSEELAEVEPDEESVLPAELLEPALLAEVLAASRLSLR